MQDIEIIILLPCKNRCGIYYFPASIFWLIVQHDVDVVQL